MVLTWDSCSVLRVQSREQINGLLTLFLNTIIRVVVSLLEIVIAINCPIDLETTLPVDYYDIIAFQMFSVAHVIQEIATAGGGPPRTVTSLSRALSKLPDVDSRVFTRCVSNDAQHLVHDVSVAQLNARTALGFRRGLTEQYRHRPFQVVHSHGQWVCSSRASASFCRTSIAKEQSVHYVVSPRGMLTPWALNQKRLKKKIAWWLFARRDLSMAAMIHATSQLEASELRALGCQQPIVVLPMESMIRSPLHLKTCENRTGRRNVRCSFLGFTLRKVSLIC